MLKQKTLFRLIRLSLIITIICSSFTIASAKGTRPFGYVDAMKFDMLQHSIISDDGNWVGYSTAPDRGDGKGFIRSTYDSTLYKVERGANPQISKSSKWAAFTVKPKAMEVENAESDKDKPKNSLAIMKLSDGSVTQIENIESYKFSNDSKWLAIKPYSEPDTKDAKDTKNAGKKSKKKETGFEVRLRHLESGTDITLQNVLEFEFDSTADYFFYSISEKSGKKNGLFYRDLHKEFCPEVKIDAQENFVYCNLEWNTRKRILAYSAEKADSTGEIKSYGIWLWDTTSTKPKEIVTQTSLKKDWYIPRKNELKWTTDGERLFFGIKPEWERYGNDKEKIKFTKDNYYDVDSIMSKAEIYIWHPDDPRIMTNQRTIWKDVKDRTYQSVYHLDKQKFVQLADTSLNEVNFSESKTFTIGYDENPYLRESTWDPGYQDVYLVNVNDGSKRKLLTKMNENAYLSPLGGYLVYFTNPHWFMYKIHRDTTINLTARFPDPFYDEDNDVPAPPQSYGIAGWLENDEAVLIYDKFDIYKFFSISDYGEFANITVADGRENNVTLRIVRLDKEKKFFSKKEQFLLSGFHNKKKWRGIFAHDQRIMGMNPLKMEEMRYNVIAKAKNANVFLYSKELYNLYPDLWVSDSLFDKGTKITDFGSQLSDFNWGAAHLVEWTTEKGKQLQGYYVLPDNYDSTKRYPVLMYFYERFSDMFYNFMTPRIHHRPCYPIYTGSGYVIFIPDIKYDSGRPGYDATDALTTGAKKLIEIGIADSNAIGIQGHSWGGYETVFAITQTNMFKAASAGAPVGNMTSAYSGIRLESGLARQMQYEKQQSRIGGTLWDSLSNYINNSFVFKAPQMNTPLLIMFGDVDPMVPWQQGQEIYLAARRLNKNCIFLQYENEPHWPNRYQNRVDYSVKMKEFFDHYLLGKPAPEWMVKGKAFKGE
ncbi:MAG: family peptidase [Ignavibacteria bacterium]|nr:family peptidase [Ignavibacteria bacterium]